MYFLCFTIPHLPLTPNRLLGRHWRVRSKHALTWQALVRAAIGHMRPKTPLSKAKLTLTRYSSMEPDADGLRGSFKHVVDSLVKLGVIEDDKTSVIGEPKVTWEKAPPKKGRISVTVESLE